MKSPCHLFALFAGLLGVVTPAQAPVPVAESFDTGRICYDEARRRLVVASPGGAIWEWDGAAWGRSLVSAPSTSQGGQIVYDPVRQRVFFVGTRTFAYDGHSLTDLGAAPAPTHLTADTQRGRLVGIRVSGSGSINGVAVHEFDGSSWSQVATIPGFCIGMSVANDRARGVDVIAVIRVSGNPPNETWEWDGVTLRGPLLGAALVYSLAYDAVRQQVIGTSAADTSAWDGTNWTLVPTTRRPFGVGSVGTDVVGGRVWWLSSGSYYRAELWQWDGTDWLPPMPVPQPYTRFANLSFDAARGCVVLLGEDQVTPTPRHVEWDGVRWVDRATTSGPLGFLAHGQTFDAARGETVVFGGALGTGPNSETWGWNGVNWRLASSAGPSPRYSPAMTYDSVRGRVVLVGGSDPVSLLALSDHWEWDGTAWTQVAATTVMGQRRGILGFDPVRNRVVCATTEFLTFEYDGSTWSQMSASGPSLSGTRNLVWHPARQTLQANFSVAPSSAARFEWNGISWNTIAGPAGELVYDSRRDVMLAYSLAGTFEESALPAAVATYGAGCGGSGTTTSLVAFGRPRPGDQGFHLDVRADAMQRPALIGLGLGSDSVPLGNGCTFLLANPIDTRIWFTDSNGFLHHPLPLPNALVLRGIVLTAQGAVLDPASPGGFALTQGLSLTIGN